MSHETRQSQLEHAKEELEAAREQLEVLAEAAARVEPLLEALDPRGLAWSAGVGGPRTRRGWRARPRVRRGGGGGLMLCGATLDRSR